MGLEVNTRDHIFREDIFGDEAANSRPKSPPSEEGKVEIYAGSVSLLREVQSRFRTFHVAVGSRCGKSQRIGRPIHPVIIACKHID
jgi:hypothetical protein